MIQRCTDPSARRYDRYGGRGIYVCREWREDFWAFYSHVGPRPSNDHSIDRIDSNGNYEPGNVRWATQLEQQRNREIHHRVEWEGRTWVLSELAEAKGIAYNLLLSRVCRGWTLANSLSTPPKCRYLDLSGRKFGNLSVVERLPGYPAKYRCLCTCGRESIARHTNLQRGKTRSCGCGQNGGVR
jgi:hypothetical protein